MYINALQFILRMKFLVSHVNDNKSIIHNNFTILGQLLKTFHSHNLWSIISEINRHCEIAAQLFVIAMKHS